MWGNLGKKCSNLCNFAVCAFNLQKNGTQNESEKFFFFWRSCFNLVVFGKVRRNLGKLRWNLGKKWRLKCLSRAVVCFLFLEVIFCFFWASLQKFGQKFFTPQKFACSYTYVSCHPWEPIKIDVLFYSHHWGEPCLTLKSILKRYNNFKCALQQHWKLFAQSTPKSAKVTMAKYEFGIKH